MTALELLHNLNLLDETERIEAKRASETGKSLLETVCAFANAPGLGGGWLLLDDEREENALLPRYQVQDAPQPDKLCADLATQCRETFNQPVRIELSTEQVSGMAVIFAFVHEAQPHDKPIVFKAQGLPKGALRRVGSVDHTAPTTTLPSFTKADNAKELAAVLRRNPQYVRNKYLRPLMRDGRLTMRNLEEPNDPQQAYRVVFPNQT
jgi:hypothetical protein